MNEWLEKALNNPNNCIIRLGRLWGPNLLFYHYDTDVAQASFNLSDWHEARAFLMASDKWTRVRLRVHIGQPSQHFKQIEFHEVWADVANLQRTERFPSSKILPYLRESFPHWYARHFEEPGC